MLILATECFHLSQGLLNRLSESQQAKCLPVREEVAERRQSVSGHCGKATSIG